MISATEISGQIKAFAPHPTLGQLTLMENWESWKSWVQCYGNESQ